MRLGLGEIVMILVVALLVFGPTKLPQLGDALGKGIRNFKRASEGEDAPATPVAAPRPELATNPQPSAPPAGQQAVTVGQRQS
jgi:sec-independent protein translocase protein TatA